MAASVATLAGTLRSRLAARAAAWARRRQGADTPPVTLTARRIYILPTRAGMGFALLLFFMLLAGLNYANSLALFVTFLLAGVGLVAMHQCQRNLLGLELLSATAMPAFAGERAAVRLVVANPTSLARYALACDALGTFSAPLDLPQGASDSLVMRVLCSRRGRIRIERLRLSTDHPYGLFRAWTWLHLPLDVLVYPRPVGARPAPAGSGLRAGMVAHGMPGDDEWAGLRPFRDGDSPRQVAWKSYARGAPLLVKDYAAGGGDVRMFDFDSLGSLDLEARLEQLARWIVDAEARGETYGLVLPSERVPPDHGDAHRHRCLAALALYGQ